MNRLLPLLGAAALLVAAPALAQYVYIDVNNDQVCNTSDVITDQTTSIDIWIDTDSNGDGSPATCIDGQGTPLNMLSYEFILHSRGNVSYGAYTNAISSFGTPFGEGSDGNDYHNGFGGGGAIELPGLHKLGTLVITVSPGTTPIIAAVPSNPNTAAWSTSFGSECPGQDVDFTIRLGAEFTSSCGPGAPTPVRATTWGAIKKIYK
jgi:hypothetical protein